MVHIAFIMLLFACSGVGFHRILESPTQEYNLLDIAVKQYQAEYVFLGKRLHGVIVRTYTKEEKNPKLCNHPLT